MKTPRLLPVLERLRWSRLSIRYKLFAIYFLIMAIPIFTLGYYLISSLRGSITRNIEQANSATLEMMARGVREQVARHLELVDTLAYNDALLAYIQTSFPDDWTAYTAYRDGIESLFRSAELRVKDVQFKVLSANRTLRFSGRFVTEPSLTGVEASQLARLDRKITWDGPLTLGERRYVVFHTPMRRRASPTVVVATLLTYMDGFNLSMPFLEARSAGIPAYLVDDEGRTLVSTVGGVAPGGDVRSVVRSGSRDYLVLELRVDDEELYVADWRIRYLAPLDLLARSVRGMWLTLLGLTALASTGIVAIITAFSRSLFRRIDGLIHGMREFAAGNRGVRGEPGHDEVGQLIGIFNGMADTIDRLISETLEARLRVQQTELERVRLEGSRNEARLQYLQSTINPHYLYNTLESIRMRTLLNGDRATSKVIRILAQSFREVTSSPEIIVPLRRELATVDDFITIQKFRFGRRLSFEVRCDPGAEDQRVPRFLLQPLVENAVFHGIEPKVGRGRVVVTIGLDGERLAIEVTDDGVGMSPERLREIEAVIAAAETPPRFAALRNLYQRLRILHGEGFRFRMHSTPGLGTGVRVELPRS